MIVNLYLVVLSLYNTIEKGADDTHLFWCGPKIVVVCVIVYMSDQYVYKCV